MSQPCASFDPGANPRRCTRCGWIKGKHRKPKRAICAVTGKTRFPNEAAARVNLHRRLGKPNEPMDTARKLMPYICEHCHSWHLGHSATGDDDPAVAQPTPEAEA